MAVRQSDEMISLALARQLKEAGLVWRTSLHDFFAIPERGLDDKVFVISDVMVTMVLIRGWPALTFHGTAEWAADHLFTHEAVWLPTEADLRQELVRQLGQKGAPALQLALRPDGEYVCQIGTGAEARTFSGETAVAAYAGALLHLLAQAGRSD